MAREGWRSNCFLEERFQYFETADKRNSRKLEQLTQRRSGDAVLLMPLIKRRRWFKPCCNEHGYSKHEHDYIPVIMACGKAFAFSMVPSRRLPVTWGCPSCYSQSLGLIRSEIARLLYLQSPSAPLELRAMAHIRTQRHSCASVK
jgi:hypothetical protein